MFPPTMHYTAIGQILTSSNFYSIFHLQYKFHNIHNQNTTQNSTYYTTQFRPHACIYNYHANFHASMNSTHLHIPQHKPTFITYINRMKPYLLLQTSSLPQVGKRRNERLFFQNNYTTS